MHSIRTKMTLLTVLAIVISLVAATLISVFAIRNLGNKDSDQILTLMCETGEKNLDSYFESIEQSVETVSSFVDEDLETVNDLDSESLEEHIDRVRSVFEKTANNTNGVTTYYYRLDPELAKDAKGFWYTDLEGDGFEEHEPTDISQYDTNDTSQLVWFTVPKATGDAVWLPPYITDNLDVRVLSYNVPVYWKGQFLGVVGIEIDYSTMAEQVDNIKLYENGYAFINDEEGTIIYHPYIDVTTMSEDEVPTVPDGLLGEDSLVRYNFDGVEKEAVWKPLSNGMRLNVSVPVSELDSGWKTVILEISIVFIVMLILFILLTLHLTGRITKPLRQLTEAARQVNAGNYDFNLEVKGDDEISLLTRTFNQLTSHLKIYIGDLNNLAYADALTSVHNKGAYDIYLRELQEKLDHGDDVHFAVGMFDCDNLKEINDKYGHAKGDSYLKIASHTICHVFEHSPVFRIGGDEFAVILQNEDYENRTLLELRFEEKCAEKSRTAAQKWEKISVTLGIAEYDREIDRKVEDVTARADKIMYENKRKKKEAQE